MDGNATSLLAIKNMASSSSLEKSSSKVETNIVKDPFSRAMMREARHSSNLDLEEGGLHFAEMDL